MVNSKHNGVPSSNALLDGMHKVVVKKQKGILARGPSESMVGIIGKLLGPHHVSPQLGRSRGNMQRKPRESD